MKLIVAKEGEWISIVRLTQADHCRHTEMVVDLLILFEPFTRIEKNQLIKIAT